MTREALSLYSYFNFIKNENKMLNNYLCNYCILHFTDKNYFYSVQDVKYTDFLREKEEWLNIIKNLNENVCNFGVKGDSCLIHIDHFNPVVGILYPVNHNIDSGIFSDYLNHFLKLFFKNENNIFENNLINEFKKYSNRILKSNVYLKFNMKRFIRFTDNNSSNVSPNFEKSNLKNLLINSQYFQKITLEIEIKKSLKINITNFYDKEFKIFENLKIITIFEYNFININSFKIEKGTYIKFKLYNIGKIQRIVEINDKIFLKIQNRKKIESKIETYDRIILKEEEDYIELQDLNSILIVFDNFIITKFNIIF
jgi:hypothetical protein